VPSGKDNFMTDELPIADIPFGFLEYRANYQEPIAPLWIGLQQGKMVNALLKALATWQVGLESFSWNQGAKNLGEAQLNVIVPSLNSGIQIGIRGLTITIQNADWSRAATFGSFFQAVVEALKQGIGQGLVGQQATLGFHVKPGAKPFREVFNQYINAKALASEDAVSFGVSVYKKDYSFVMDSSVNFPGGVFVKLIRNFTADKQFEEMTIILRRDEEQVLNFLGLKLQ
jgi:hypothetical protein